MVERGGARKPEEDAPTAADRELERLAGNFRFVLVEPREPGNIGASARALKNMGFHRLVLVKGASTTDEEARQMAVTAADVLDGAERVADIPSAVTGAVLVAATTRRQRQMIQPRPMLLAAAVERLIDAGRSHPVAILFGNEKWGLAGDDLEHAGLLVKIPTSPAFGSLNLAQSVLLVAYELRRALVGTGLARPAGLPNSKRSLADAAQYDQLYRAAEQALVASGFFPTHRIKNGMATLRGIFSRARLEQREIKFLLGLFGRLGHPPPR